MELKKQTQKKLKAWRGAKKTKHRAFSPQMNMQTRGTSSETPLSSELERLVSLRAIDDLWADYLATITDLREGVQWISWGGRDPLHESLTSVHARFTQLEEQLDAEIANRMEEAEASGLDPSQRGATWTYL